LQCPVGHPETAPPIFVVAGWLSGSGVLYNPAWLNPDLTLPLARLLQEWACRLECHQSGTGVAGGLTSSSILPNLDIFWRSNRYPERFLFFLVSFVPEPSSVALAGLGAAVLMVFRRRSRPNPPTSAKPGDDDSMSCLRPLAPVR